MEPKVITRRAVLQVLRDYLAQYKRMPIRSSIGFLMPACGTILVSFIPPLIVARIVNIFAGSEAIVLFDVGMYVALLAASWFLGEILWRIGMHFVIAVEAQGLNALNKLAFSRLAARDYDFYTNNFVGSLTKKALAYGRSFEILTDVLSFNIITNLLFPVIFAVLILGQYSWWIPAALVGSILVTVVVALPLIRHRSRLVALRHEQIARWRGGFRTQ